MTRPTSRVLRLLELLQSSGTRTARELAGQLGVDERTVRRYVDHLLELEVPVEAVRGRYGGYRVAPGFRMPPLMLSDEEAVAVLLALAALRAAPAAGVPDTASATAAAKISRALPERLARRARTLLDTTVFTDPPARTPVPDAGVLLTVADAVRHRRPVEIRYRSADAAPSERRVHPYELAAYRGAWYLTALDVRGQGERTFRLDRIAGARSVPGSFPPPSGPRPSLVDRFARADHAHHVTLRVRATEERIRARLPPSVAVLEPVPPPPGDAEGTWYRAEIRAVRLDWLPGVIAALDCTVVVERPAELRELVGRLATRLAATSVTVP